MKSLLRCLFYFRNFINQIRYDYSLVALLRLEPEITSEITGRCRVLTLSFLFCLVALTSVAQLPPSLISAKAYTDWADYDNDGDMDLLFSYAHQSTPFIRVTKILTNSGGIFTANADTLTQTFGRVSWGDFDNDGDLDFAQIGSVPGIYRNNGGGTFTILPDVIANYVEDLAWGDYDNDGDLDLVVGGTTTGTYFNLAHIRLYQNNNSSFTEVLGFSPLSWSLYNFYNFFWVDYDNDGDLDLSFSNDFGGPGNVVTNKGVFVLQNNGGTFSDSGINLLATRASWGDYDEDGDLDVGCSRSHSNRYVYFSNTTGVFTDNTQLDVSVPFLTGLSAFGDYDNDGDLDHAIAGGFDGSSNPGGIFLNRGSSLALATSITSFRSPVSGGFADYDNDGDLDFLISGDQATAGNTSSFLSILYNNAIAGVNTPPAVPSGLAASFGVSDCNITSTSAIFSWNASTDNETASLGLTYNLRIGITPGGSEVMSVANSLKPVMGNVQQNTSWTIQGLDPNINYYWSVEAVDNSYEGSGFAVESIYTQSGSLLFNDAGFSLPGIGVGSIEWGDFDKDGDLDILSAGNQQSTGGTGSADIYRNDGSSFVAINAGFVQVTESKAVFVDFDNDNDLDVCVMGKNPSGTPVIDLYRNTGTTFTRIIDTNFGGLYDGSMDWGDFDRNGFLDLAVMGKNSSNEPTTKLIRNLGGSFIEEQIAFPGLYDGDLAWHDPSDGFIDLVMSGKDINGNHLTHYYRNDAGQLTFLSASVIDIAQVSNSSIAANNISPPNFYEYMIMGTSSLATNMYHYVFDDNTEVHPGLMNGDVLWIDYDNDGDNDAVITGVDTQTSLLKTVLYENNNENYSLICNSFPLEGFGKSRVATGDYDNDGDLDVLFTSFGNTGQAFGKIYRNGSTVVNTPPTTPANVSLLWDDCNTISVTWDPATDANTPVNLLTYNVTVGTTPGGADIIPPTALSNGDNLLVRSGNVGTASSFEVNVTSGGMYYVGVQTVDNGFATSSFTEDSILVSSTVVDLFESHLFSLPNQTIWLNIVPVDLDANSYMDILQFFGRYYYPSQILYKNTSSGLTATDSYAVIGNSYLRSIDDYDHDGDLDLHYRQDRHYHQEAELDSGYFYLNNGNGQFTASPGFLLEDQDTLNLEHIFDYNNDGYQDYILRSYSERDGTVTWWRFLNNENGIYDKKAFLQKNSNVPRGQFQDRIVSIIDYNNDSYKDLLITAPDSAQDYNPVMILYRNDQNDQFTPVYQFPKSRVYTSELRMNNKWGDFDDDNDLDFVIFSPGQNSNLQIFRNDGQDSFSKVVDLDPLDISNNTEESYRSFVFLGDMDNDGDLDLIASTATSYTDLILLVENQGNFQFTPKKICLGSSPSPEGLTDIDNDNDLDILVSDYILIDTAFYEGYFYENLTAQQNTPPDAPGNLSSFYNVVDSSLTFSWGAALDGQTPSSGLNYNIRVGKSSNFVDLIHPKSLVTPGTVLDGKRQVIGIGNVAQARSWRLHNVTPGQDYYWSVQAIDHSYVGSAFAIEQVAAANISNGTGTLSGIMGSGSGSSGGGRVISGRKMEVDSPVADVRIALVNILTSDTLLLDKTDSKGNFDFLGVPNGAYKVHVDYNNLPMDANNPTLNFVQDDETIEVTVLVNGGKLSVTLNSRITGTEEDTLQKQIQIFPNPTSGFVNIKVQQPVIISLISLTGRLLDTFSIGDDGEATLNTSSYPPGLYILRIATEKAFLNYKLVKQ